MGKPTGFLEIERHDRGYEKPDVRRKTWKEFLKPLPEPELAGQAARCMDCGIPFCHNGCPVNNLIPDWNNLVYRHQWQAAVRSLHSTNNFPGVHRPHLSRAVRGVLHAEHRRQPGDHQDDRVRHRRSRLAGRLDHAPSAVAPNRQARRGGRFRSGRPRLCAAARARRACGDAVREERPHRRPAALRHSRLQDGEAPDRPPHRADDGRRRRVPHRHRDRRQRCRSTSLLHDFDAVVLSGGAEWPRDLDVPGRELDGIHFAMDFLTQQNKRVAGDDEARATAGRGTISAKGKHVVVIGGGDTGSDCIGTSVRQGAASITQLEILPKPPEHENKALTWPDWPLKLRSSHAHEEGCDRDWAVLTKRAIGLSGNVEALECVRVEWAKGADGRMAMREMPGSKFQLKADLVLLAMGFLGPRKHGMVEQARVALDRARQRAGEHDGLSDLGGQGVRRRRHAPRPVAGGVGHPRRPPMRARRRRVSDGQQHTAQVNASGAAARPPPACR